MDDIGKLYFLIISFPQSMFQKILKVFWHRNIDFYVEKENKMKEVFKLNCFIQNKYVINIELYF